MSNGIRIIFDGKTFWYNHGSVRAKADRADRLVKCVASELEAFYEHLREHLWAEQRFWPIEVEVFLHVD